MKKINQLLKNLRLGILDMRYQWSNKYNKESLRIHEQDKEVSQYCNEPLTPLVLDFFVAGHCKEFILYRQQAAQIISKLSQSKVTENKLCHGSIHCRYNAEYHSLPENCWFFENYFVEIGPRAAYGKINKKYFRFKESEKMGEPEFIIKMKCWNFLLFENQRYYDLEYTLNEDGDVTPKEMFFYRDIYFRNKRESVAQINERLKIEQLNEMLLQDRRQRSMCTAV